MLTKILCVFCFQTLPGSESQRGDLDIYIKGRAVAAEGVAPVSGRRLFGINESFVSLNMQAIQASTSQWMMVEDIYDFYYDKFRQLKTLSATDDKNWKSSVRHALSSSKNKFIKREVKTATTDSVRYVWGINPAYDAKKIKAKKVGKVMKKEKVQSNSKCAKVEILRKVNQQKLSNDITFKPYETPQYFDLADVELFADDG